MSVAVPSVVLMTTAARTTAGAVRGRPVPPVGSVGSGDWPVGSIGFGDWPVGSGGWPVGSGAWPVDPGEPLLSTTFVVVDCETTGGDPGVDRITEIGAVRVQGGSVLGELATLVDPDRPIPPAVVEVTGMTDALVHGAPRIGAVLPAFAEFARGGVLVAHNAPFDVGFLRAEADRCGTLLHFPLVLDTVQLARSVLDRDEAPDCRLATLAALFRSTVVPVHRALADARATVEVLHGLLERLGGQGIATFGQLCEHRAPAGLRRRDPPGWP